MKRTFLTSMLLLVFLAVTSQITLNAPMPLAGVVARESLWNITLTNNGDNVSLIGLRFNVQDPVSGETLLSGSSGRVRAEKGINLLTLQNVSPVQYNFSNPAFNGNFLPVGSYVICYQVSEGELVSSEQCGNFTIDPLSPPLLNTPNDLAEIDEQYPLFTWLPPGSAGRPGEFEYDFVLSGIEDDQLALEAVQYNAPVFSRTGIRQAMLNYPPGIKALERGKKYAWQVVARNNLNYAAKTEVWVFTVSRDSLPTNTSGTSYTMLHADERRPAIVENGLLRMGVKNATTDTLGIFQLTGMPMHESERKHFARTFTLPLITGMNFLEYDLRRFGRLNPEVVYVVKYRNSNGEVVSMKFTPIYSN